jgi:hypothetical protein
MQDGRMKKARYVQIDSGLRRFFDREDVSSSGIQSKSQIHGTVGTGRDALPAENTFGIENAFSVGDVGRDINIHRASLDAGAAGIAGHGRPADFKEGKTSHYF